MATWADIWGNISRAAKVFHYRLARQDDLLADINAYIGESAASLVGPRAALAGVGMEAFRTAFAALIDSFRDIIDPHIIDLQQVTHYGQVGVIDDSWWAFLRAFMADNGHSIQSRALTFDAPIPVGSLAGNGQVHVLHRDLHDQDIEAVDITETLLRCVYSKNTGTAKGREVFRLSQGPQPKDGLELGGSGEVADLAAIAGDDGLENSSFQTPPESLTAPSEIPGWSYVDDTDTPVVPATEVEFSTSNYYRVSPEEENQDQPYSLVLKHTGSTRRLFQPLRQRSLALERMTPVFYALALDATTGGAQGNAILWLGSAQVAVLDLTALPAGWSVVRPQMDSYLYPVNFDVQDLRYQLEVNLTAGTLGVDTAMCSNMSRFRGLWWMIEGGTQDFLAGDSFKQGTAVTTEAVLQLMFVLLYQVYLTHKATPTIPDPTP